MIKNLSHGTVSVTYIYTIIVKTKLDFTAAIKSNGKQKSSCRVELEFDKTLYFYSDFYIFFGLL